MYYFNNIFFRTITVMGDCTLRCLYVHNVLVLNCEIDCKWDRSQKLRLFILRGGEGGWGGGGCDIYDLIVQGWGQIL